MLVTAFEAEKAKIEALYRIDGEIIELDVGGTHLTSSRSTLMRFANEGSVLAAMLSGRHKLAVNKGRIFIDRDPGPFAQMLSFLRTGQKPVFSDREQCVHEGQPVSVEEKRFYRELEFWQIPYPELMQLGTDEVFLRRRLVFNYFDKNWMASSLCLEKNDRRVHKRMATEEHGIVYCKLPLDESNPYVEFLIDVPIEYVRSYGRVFVGLVDQRKHNRDNLLSKRWDSQPSSIYWQVWNQKYTQVKADGHYNMYISQNCACLKQRMRIGMMYHHAERKVSFYKNGVKQGVVFRNVKSGLTPSVDLFLDSTESYVEIMKVAKPMPEQDE